MDATSGAPPAPGPAVVAVSRPSLQRLDAAVATTAAAVLLLLLLFVVWPVLRVLGASIAGPTGPTLAHYAEVFGPWRLLPTLVHSLAVSVVSTVIPVAVAPVLAYAWTRQDIPRQPFVSTN